MVDHMPKTYNELYIDLLRRLKDAGVDQTFIENCKKIHYLRYKADLAAEMLHYRKHL